MEVEYVAAIGRELKSATAEYRAAVKRLNDAMRAGVKIGAGVETKDVSRKRKVG